jgi:FkbM family methyltransferase
MYPTNYSFWVAYKQHQYNPTFLKDAGPGQEPQRETALKYVKKWNTCIDVGSQFGFWTRPLLKRFKTVHCFEPNPLFRECFLKNIPLDNVTLHPYGLSNSEHTAHQSKDGQVLSMGEGSVQCRTLDSFKFDNVDFIKIDVDGYEHKVLIGAKQTIKKFSPVINIEMKRMKRSLIVFHCTNFLKKRGYKMVKRVKSDEVWVKKVI